MTDTSRFPFIIHGTDPAGITIVTRAETAFTASGVMLYEGDELEITEEIHRLNCGRDGETSFLDRESTQFGLGPTPARIKDAVEAARLARLRVERNFLLQRNPHLAKANGVAKHLDRLNAAIGD